jgi:hypothetical protein
VAKNISPSDADTVRQLRADVRDLSDRIEHTYAPHAQTLWGKAATGGRRLTGELLLTLNVRGGSPMPGSLTAITEACDEVLGNGR